MTQISVKLLASIVTVLTAIAAILGTYNVHVAVNPVDTVFGAVSSLDGVDSPFINIAGSKAFWGSRSMYASSTNFCVIKNPLGVPVVIDKVSFNVQTNRLGAVGFDMSTSTDGFATSSVILARGTLPAQGTAYQYAWTGKTSSTTVSSPLALPAGQSILAENTAYDGGSTRFVLGASEYLNFKFATTSGGGATVTAGYNVGTCSFLFRAF